MILDTVARTSACQNASDRQAKACPTRLFDAGDHGKDGYYAAIEKQVSLCFFCVDGFSWEFYSKDQGAVTQVFEHVRLMGGVNLERARLLDRE